MSYRKWIVSNLKEYDHNKQIENIIPIGDSLIKIVSKKGKTIIVGVVDKEVITSLDADRIYKSETQKPNYLVAKSKSVWKGCAINYAYRQGMGWGGVGDITSLFNKERYQDVQKTEYRWVETNLAQHTRVDRLERLYDRVFKIHRIGGFRPLTITLINSYELSGEEVRHARDTYGDFDIILKTNPNGEATGRAHSAAEEIGAEILKWGELLGRLNKK